MIFEIVKRVIRNKGTHAYLSFEGNWVADILFAQDFEDAVSAFRAADRLKVKDAELVFVMGQVPSGTYDVTIPIPGGRVGRAIRKRKDRNIERRTLNFQFRRGC